MVEFRKRHLAVGIDESLLIDPAHALERPRIERILGPAITGAFAFKLSVASFSCLAFSRATTWGDT